MRGYIRFLVSGHGFRISVESFITKDPDKTTEVDEGECDGTFTGDFECIQAGFGQSAKLQSRHTLDDAGELCNPSQL